MSQIRVRFKKRLMFNLKKVKELVMKAMKAKQMYSNHLKMMTKTKT